MQDDLKVYSVFPKTTIRNVPEYGFIFKSGTYNLSKEGVLICMKGGSVYRRFSADLSERVTALNLDRLHNDEYISEKDWKAMNSTKNKVEEVEAEEPANDTIVEEVAPTPEENKESEVANEKVDPTAEVESPVEESVESNNEEDTTAEEVNNDEQKAEDTQEVVETKEENKVIDILAEEENSENNKPNYNINYNGKKKHK